MKLKIMFVAIVVVCGFSFQILACGFQAMGVTKENAKAVETTLKSITPEVEFNPKDGAIHFLSKAPVTQEQVDAAFVKAGITGVKVKAVHH